MKLISSRSAKTLPIRAKSAFPKALSSHQLEKFFRKKKLIARKK